ncbi:TauD/TfdA dioxygenase family protein [Roseateles terrae]|uniref:Taurine dioxygenase n=1 Tax=Roseateles terrae TaxID=431060 RepID=A0ABR6H070_9BURK|nr:TauD/TfdA family dioxygenase [Roseateles terrae]MBB3196813.1 taurine dioxygenase [Roseateles terrae]OWQ84621.1 taurine dioxygenase [Roseateles terrae]
MTATASPSPVASLPLSASPTLSATAAQRPSARSSRFEIRPFDGPLGAEVLGLDLDLPVDAATFAQLHRAHLDHHVLVFRDQRITPAAHVAFSRRWGPLEIHVLRNFQLPDHPEILQVSNVRDANGQPRGLGDAGVFWHSDLSYKEKPSLGSLLHAQELPAEGGDTLFANQHLAYQELPQALKDAVRGLRAEHSYLARYEELRARNPWRPALTEAQIAEVRPAVHPVVRIHPETGRPGLFVSEHFTTRIVGIPEDESRDLLQQLYALSTRDALVYRHRWQPHDLVFWDNRSVMHLATGCPEHLRRHLHRTTIEGTAVIG